MSRATRAVWAQFPLLQLKEGVLYLKSPRNTASNKPRMVLPHSLIKVALTEVHDDPAGAHLGRMKTMKKMSARFWRPGLTKQVHRYCDGCLTCAKCKSRPRPRAPLQPFPSGNPMQRIHIDIVGPLPRTRRGNRYILTAQCSFTKWVEAFPIPNQRATTCAKVLVRNWICRFGVPDSIHSDQGRNFESKVFEEICHLLQMKKTRSTAYHPEGNGQVENIHKTLKSMLQSGAEDNPKSWDENLDYCMTAYRSSVHTSTEHTPFELVFGREMRIPLDVMMGGAQDNECSYTEFVADLQDNFEAAYRSVRQNLKISQRRQKDAYDKGVKHTVYHPGDLVLRYTPQVKPGEARKFHRQWQGPFEIVKQVTEVTYLVKKVGGRSRRSKVVHFNNLRLYRRKPEEVREEDAANVVGSPGGAEAAVVEGEGGQDDQESEVPEESGYQSHYTYAFPPGMGEEDVQSNPVVDVPPVRRDVGDESGLHLPRGNDADQRRDITLQEHGSEKTLPVQSNQANGSVEDGDSKHEVEEEQSTSQSQRPVRVRKPPDRYGEWIVSSLQEVTARLQMLEEKQIMEKNRINKLKPKLLRKAKALRGH